MSNAQLRTHAEAGVPHAREYVEAMLGPQDWSHKLYLAAVASAHAGKHHHEGWRVSPQGRRPCPS